MAVPDAAEMDGDEESDDEMEEAPDLVPMAPIDEGAGGGGGGAAAADDGWTSVTRSGRKFGAN